MTPEMTLTDAMALADQDCPLPVLAGRALRLMRDRIRELEAAQPPLADGERLPTLDGFRGLNPDTLALVRRFAYALACKLSAAEQKYGYSDGWANNDWMDECRQKLVEHVAKGDPRDVAAYCAFLWHHGERTALPAAVVDEAMVKSIAGHVRKWMGPIGSDLGAAHVATLHGAIVDGMSAARRAALRGNGVQEVDEAALRDEIAGITARVTTPRLRAMLKEVWSTQAQQGEAVGANALAVLGYIRDARRHDRKCFEDDTAFADWAQSWARHATQVYSPKVDEAMVDRYLAAQKETICRLDRQWGTHAGGSDHVRDACKAGLIAALRGSGVQAQQGDIHEGCGGFWCDYVQAENKIPGPITQHESAVSRYVLLGLMCDKCGAERLVHQQQGEAVGDKAVAEAIKTLPELDALIDTEPKAQIAFKAYRLGRDHRPQQASVPDAPKHGDDAGDGLRYVLCKVGFGDHYRDWLLIPHAGGQYVTAAKLQPFSMAILQHQLAATAPMPEDNEGLSLAQLEAGVRTGSAQTPKPEGQGRD